MALDESRSAQTSAPPQQPQAHEPGPAAAETVSKVASEYLDAAHGELMPAVEAFEARVHSDSSLFFTLMRPMVRTACFEAVNKLIRDRRAGIKRGVLNIDAILADSARVTEVAESLLDWPLPGGKLLRNATAQDCQDAMRKFTAQAATCAGNARFLKEVAQRIGRKTVAECLGGDALMKLYKKAQQP